jgi:DNA ligase-1
VKFAPFARYLDRIEATASRLDMYEILAEMFAETSAEDIDKAIYLCQGVLRPPFLGVEIGMSDKLLERAIAEAAGARTDAVLALSRETGDLGAVAERLIAGSPRLSLVEVYGELLAIAGTAGKGSVEGKINQLASLLRACSPIEARYVARFVVGRLRLGVGDPTVLEALAILVIEGLGEEGAIDLAVSMGLLDREGLPKKPAEVRMRVRAALKGPLERAYNMCSDLGLIARTLKAEGMEGIGRVRIILGYPVRMALCERLSSAEEIVAKLGRAALEAKYDGLRLQIHKDGAHVEIFSRNLERMTPMFPEVREAARALPAREAIIEGEALAHNETTGELLPFQVTVQRKRKHGIAEAARDLPLKFFAFDLLYLDGEDWTPRPYRERRARLETLVAGNSLITTARMVETDDPAVIHRHFEEFVETGLEGVVAKKLDAPYAAGARNFNWIKLKRSYRGELADTVDLAVIGYFYGRGQRARFGIGAVLAAVYDTETDSFKSVTKVGTGFTEDEFGRLKALLDEAALDKPHPRVDSAVVPDVWVEPRYVIEVTADEITRSPSHTAGRDAEGIGYALRFPRAVGFLRTDKKAEDATSVAEIIALSQSQKKVKIS